MSSATSELIGDHKGGQAIRRGTLRIDAVGREVGLANLPFAVGKDQQLLLTARTQTNGSSGPGMPDNIGPLFVPFYRPHPSDAGVTQIFVYDIQANRHTASFEVDFVLIG